eukprot:4885863-Pleurochrysis_carterae.AAC.2
MKWKVLVAKQKGTSVTNAEAGREGNDSDRELLVGAHAREGRVGSKGKACVPGEWSEDVQKLEEEGELEACTLVACLARREAAGLWGARGRGGRRGGTAAAVAVKARQTDRRGRCAVSAPAV